MEPTKLALLLFSFLAITSCDESNRVYEKHCKTPPANWATEADHNKLDELGGVVDPIYNVIDLDSSGSLSWNGSPINKMELTKYLGQSDNQDPIPMIIVRVDDVTPCNHVEDLREIMMKSETCQRPEKLCTEDNPEPDPPPPENETDALPERPND